MLTMPFAFSDEIQDVLQICDPTSSGFVSMEYFTQLARAHYQNKVEADKLINQLDARGRPYISYTEFANAINAILNESDNQEKGGNRRTKEKKGKDIMMAPSVGKSLISNEETQNDVNGDVYMSDGESYESYGQMDTYNATNPSDGAPRTGNTLRRNTWLRSSLKRSSNNHDNLPNRRWGSFRQPSGVNRVNASNQLNRSSSFNSSGRSSTCDTADDVYSDVSLEEEVLDLNHRVQMLQEQMSALADNQTNGDERYTRVKQDNATLQARILMLEEQLREIEFRSQEKLRDEEKWHKEMISRMESEKQLQLENSAIRMQSLEMENCSLRDEATRCRVQMEKLRAEMVRLEEEQSRCEANLSVSVDELKTAREEERESRQAASYHQRMAEELSAELERLRLEHKQTLDALETRTSGISPTAHEELRSKFSLLKDENKRLQEVNDEMQALLLTKSLEEGRSLLTGHPSLAAELDALSQDEARAMLKEQQEVNAQLRSYIDNILLNIVDNYPQLLEVKPALP